MTRALPVTVAQPQTARQASRPNMRVLTYATDGWMAAVSAGDEFRVKRMIEVGQDIHVRDTAGWNALLIATVHGRAAIVMLLLAQGAHLNARDRHGNTALMWACRYQLVAIARMLITAKASLTRKNHRGQTALMLAAEACNDDTVHAIIVACFRKLMHVQDDDGMTALHYACLAGGADCAHRLVYGGSLVNCRAKSGHSALMLAARRGHEAIVEVLLAGGADATMPLSKKVRGCTCAWNSEARASAHAVRQCGCA